MNVASGTISAFDTSPHLPVKLKPSADLPLSPELQDRISSPPASEPTACHEPVNQPANLTSTSNEELAVAVVENTTLVKHEKRPNPFTENSDASPQKANLFDHTQDTSGSISNERMYRGTERMVGVKSATLLGGFTLGEVLDILGRAPMSKEARKAAEQTARRVKSKSTRDEKLADVKQEETLFSYFVDSEMSKESTLHGAKADLNHPVRDSEVMEKGQDPDTIEGDTLEDEIRYLKAEIFDVRGQLALERRRNAALDRLLRSLTGLNQGDTAPKL